ncbi:MAG: hypothetical protein ACREUV_03855 [Burkholderiales bacterium]
MALIAAITQPHRIRALALYEPTLFALELILAKARALDLVFVQTTKEVHHEQRKNLQRQLLLRCGSVHRDR